MFKKRFVKGTIIAIAVVAALSGGVDFLIHDYDPTRVLYQRLKADNAYVYDEIDPAFLALDPADLIAIDSPGAADALRARLIELIWGRPGLPVAAAPATVETAIADEALAALANLATIDRITVDMGRDVRSTLYHLKPAKNPNRKLVIYHHGFNGEIRDVPDVLAAFLARGYEVLGVNMMAYGGNSNSVLTDAGASANLHFDLDQIEQPLRYHFEPLVIGVNHVLGQGGIDAVHMVGFSAGAFFTTVMAAIDGRIANSYPVAGVYPIYLREEAEIQPRLPSYYPPLLSLASYPDLFTLGASGAGRGQLQIFNRYDRCCYRNAKGRLYEAAVAAAVDGLGRGGSFAVFIDESHADHRLSRAALEIILTHMESQDQ